MEPEGADVSEVQVPYNRPAFMKPEWYSGVLSGDFKLASGDFIRDSHMNVKFEIVSVEVTEDLIWNKTFRNFKLSFYRGTQKQESAKHSVECVCAAIEICGYSVWRKGRKVWPLEGS